MALVLFSSLFLFSLVGLVFLGIRNERLQKERLMQDQLLIWNAATVRRKRGSSL